MLLKIGIDRDRFCSSLLQSLQSWESKNVYGAIINALEDSLKEFLIDSNGLSGCFKKNSIIDIEFGFNKITYEESNSYPHHRGLSYFLGGLELSVTIRFILKNTCFDSLEIDSVHTHGFLARTVPASDGFYMLSDYGVNDYINKYEAETLLDELYPEQVMDNFDDVCEHGFYCKYPFAIPFERINVSKRTLKTQTNVRLDIPRVFLDGGLFKEAGDLLEDTLSDKLISDTTAGDFRDCISFNNAFTDEKFLCECFRGFHKYQLSYLKNDIKDITNEQAIYKAEYGHNDKSTEKARLRFQNIINLLELTPYRNEICHMCVSVKNGVESIIPTYGDLPKRITSYYDEKHEYDSKIGFNEAIAEVKSIIGVDRWKSETELYFVVKGLFRGYRVTREASPEWLGRQRLDIYVHELRLAFEYQGRQHYEAVDFFGGEDAFLRNQERDKEKFHRCKENGVEIVYIRYDEKISRSMVKRKVSGYLQ